MMDNKRKFGSSDNPQQKANDPPPPSYSWRIRGVTGFTCEWRLSCWESRHHLDLCSTRSRLVRPTGLGYWRLIPKKWRNRGVLPSILTQPPRPCSAVATKTVTEAILKTKFGYTVPLSLQYLLDNVTPFEMKQRHGMCTQKDYPYKGFKQYGLPHPTRYDIIKSVVSLNLEEGEKIRATIVEHPIYGLVALLESVKKFKFKSEDDLYRATEE